jgi:hypothetical protein
VEAVGKYRERRCRLPDRYFAKVGKYGKQIALGGFHTSGKTGYLVGGIIIHFHRRGGD